MNKYIHADYNFLCLMKDAEKLFSDINSKLKKIIMESAVFCGYRR